MSDSLNVYDLGEVDVKSNRPPLFTDDTGAAGSSGAGGAGEPGPPASAAAERTARMRAQPTAKRRPGRSLTGSGTVSKRDSFKKEIDYLDRQIPTPRRVGWRISGSMSMWIPGSGQLALGDYAHGLFFLSTLGLMGTLGWAMLNSLERTVGTLILFDYPGAAAFWMLGVVYFVAIMLYMANVLSATAHADDHSAATSSPILSGVASGLLPGWGQVLNGDRVRAVLFLTSVASLVAVGITISAPARVLLDRFDMYLPYWDQLGAAPTLKWTIPLLVWALAIYDASSSAIARRRKRDA